MTEEHELMDDNKESLQSDTSTRKRSLPTATGSSTRSRVGRRSARLKWKVSPLQRSSWQVPLRRLCSREARHPSSSRASEAAFAHTEIPPNRFCFTVRSHLESGY